jgi:hypothetical protein
MLLLIKRDCSEDTKVLDALQEEQETLKLAVYESVEQLLLVARARQAKREAGANAASTATAAAGKRSAAQAAPAATAAPAAAAAAARAAALAAAQSHQP